MISLGKRIVEKAKTRQKILDATEYLIKRRGFVKISSRDISKECGVSQGSIYLHFETKEHLLMTILGSNIDSLETELRASCNPDLPQEILMKNFLDSISLFEDMMSRVYRDYSYLNIEITKKIQGLENYMKNLIFDNYKKNSKSDLGIVDSFIAIDAVLSQIKDYLMSKETFTVANSVIKQKRGRIVKLYKLLFL